MSMGTSRRRYKLHTGHNFTGRSVTWYRPLPDDGNNETLCHTGVNNYFDVGNAKTLDFCVSRHKPTDAEECYEFKFIDPGEVVVTAPDFQEKWATTFDFDAQCREAGVGFEVGACGWWWAEVL